LQPDGLECFFDFLVGLEEAQLISKKEILLAFIELFEIAQEQVLLPLFDMMEAKLFNGGQKEEQKQAGSKNSIGERMFYILSNLNEKDSGIVFNICARICKIIMKKLSATHDTEFRGRIQKLIASVFPLTHPSGLNKPGNFNLKNQTQFESLEEIKEQIESQKARGQGANVATDSKLYRNFWNLQKYLANPLSIFTS
jgi:hypothetical protein